MKLTRMLIFACFAVLALGRAAFAEVSLKDGQLSYPADVPNKDKLSDYEAQYGPVEGSDFTYAISVDPYDGAKPVIYFFGKDGKLAAKLHASEDFSFEDFAIDSMFMSPKGNVVAIDNGTWIVRGWEFFSFPELKPLDRDVSYMLAVEDSVRQLFWVDNDNVLVQQIDDSSDVRKADYDPQGPLSIAIYTVSSGQLKNVFTGTDLCDYVLESFKDQVVTAQEVCAPKLEDWKTFEGVEKLPRKTVTKNIADIK